MAELADLASYLANSLAAAQGAEDQPDATLRFLDAAGAIAPGHILFTVLVYRQRLEQSQRFYTNMPEAYPVGGSKPIVDSAWTRQVIRSGRAYLGRTAADIRDVFFDHELIASLGCGSVVNAPVLWQGRVLGTVNFLHREFYYDASHIPAATLIAQLAVPALMLLQDDKSA